MSALGLQQVQRVGRGVQSDRAARANRVPRSQRGASLSAALLLFLVCTALSAVILAAGTAASGRVSELSAMDARYYSVTSAARVFKREFDGRAVRVVRRKISTYTVTTTYDADGNEGPSSAGTPTVRYENEAVYLTDGDTESGVPAGSVAGDPFCSLALQAVFGQTSVPTTDADTFWNRDLTASTAIDEQILTLTVTPSGTSSADSGLTVRAKCARDFATGAVSMQLSNVAAAGTSGNATTDEFVFPVVFGCDVQEEQDTDEKPLGYSSSISGDTVTVTEQIETTETKTTTYTWRVSQFGTGERA